MGDGQSIAGVEARERGARMSIGGAGKKAITGLQQDVHCPLAWADRCLGRVPHEFFRTYAPERESFKKWG